METCQNKIICLQQSEPRFECQQQNKSLYFYFLDVDEPFLWWVGSSLKSQDN